MRYLPLMLAGLLVVGTANRADVRGWLGRRGDVLTNVPRSIRDNPGAYRTLYSASPRYFGGK